MGREEKVVSNICDGGITEEDVSDINNQGDRCLQFAGKWGWERDRVYRDHRLMSVRALG